MSHQKVVWYEGMFLTPHHFQQEEQYYAGMLNERVREIAPFGWGVMEMNLDTDGLSNGNIALLGFKGVMPDGLRITLPDPDFSPETRSIGPLFPPTADHLDLFLGIPSEHPGAVNCLLNAAASPRPARYTAEYIKTPDDNTGENLHEIAVARKNLKIFVAGEEMGDYVTIKIAELVRTAGGAYALRESYVPPCLAISASPYLMRMTRGLLEVLSAKCNALSGLREAAGSGSADPAKFALLCTLHRYIPVLSHFCRVGTVPPEALFLSLAQLAGELTAFSGLYQLKEIPSYHHTDLTQTFTPLEQTIRTLVEGVSQAQYTTIPLVASTENVRVGRVTDERMFATLQFFFKVACDLPAEQVWEQMPRKLRVGSADELGLIRSSALPGLKLYPVPRPPTTLPVGPGYTYFRLDNHGAFWDSICRSQTVALYVPADLVEMKIELLAVKA